MHSTLFTRSVALARNPFFTWVSYDENFKTRTCAKEGGTEQPKLHDIIGTFPEEKLSLRHMC